MSSGFNIDDGRERNAKKQIDPLLKAAGWTVTKKDAGAGDASPASTLLFSGYRISLDLYSFPVLHVMNVLGNLAGMVSTAFKVTGDHDVVRAA